LVLGCKRSIQSLSEPLAHPEHCLMILFQRRSLSFGPQEFSRQVFVDLSVACCHSPGHRNNLAYRVLPSHCGVFHPDQHRPQIHLERAEDLTAPCLCPSRESVHGCIQGKSCRRPGFAVGKTHIPSSKAFQRPAASSFFVALTNFEALGFKVFLDLSGRAFIFLFLI